MSPYTDDTANFMYHLLFCDSRELFQKHYSGDLAEPWITVFADQADYPALRKIAEDSNTESRVRMLAFNRLREGGQDVPSRVYLGTIIEVRVGGGLDTLAVFADGTARYINHSGKMAMVEGAPAVFLKEISAVIETSKPIVDMIGPWDKERLPPPSPGSFRMSFLVSDGLYFGEGPADLMTKDVLAAPLIDKATILLQKLTAEFVEKES